MRAVQKRPSKWKKKTMSGLLAATLCVSASMATPAFAQPDTSDMEQRKQELQQQIDEASQQIAALESQQQTGETYLIALAKKMDLVQEKIDALNEELQALQSQINALNQQILEKETEIQKLESEIAQQQKQFDEKREQYNQRLRILYMSGAVTNLEALLTSEDIATLLTRAELISSVSQRDQAALDDLVASMKAIQKNQEALKKSKQKLDDSKVELLTSKSALDDSMRSIASEKALLEQDRQNNQQALLNYQKEQERLSGFIHTSEAEQAAIDAEIAQAIKDYEDSLAQGGEQGGSSGGETSGGESSGGETSGGQTSGGESSGGESSGGFDYSYIGTGVYKGRFVHPCPDRMYVSVVFPYYSDNSWHGATDFGCWSYNPPIYAADTGTVITVRDLGNRSYGKYLVIRHEKGLYTLYAHCNQIYVIEGQTVNRGQEIAQVGTTGNSSGNHLHFEIRLGDGSSNQKGHVDDPAKYFDDTGFPY